MSEMSAADEMLLEAVRRGDAEGWEQLVDRYSGRLLAFARRQANASDADDLVQDTFISFLRGLPNFRGEASLETYLFTILRRRIVDKLRKPAHHVTKMGDLTPTDDPDSNSFAGDIPGDMPTASWHVAQSEARGSVRQVLSQALRDVVQQMKDDGNLRHLKMAEAIFYAQLRNKEIAELLGERENQIALFKHRTIDKLRRSIPPEMAETALPEDLADVTIARLWEQQRLSCPKRSTLGQFHLGTLDGDWDDYVRFHVETLGCTTCAASLEDLRQQTSDAEAKATRERIMASTIGFLK